MKNSFCLLVLVCLFQQTALSSEEPIARFSSTNLPILSNPWAVWAEWLRYDKGWLIFISGTSKEDKGGRIYRWEDQGTPELLIYSTPREGFRTFAGVASDPTGTHIMVKGWRSPWIYSYSIEEPKKGFKRFQTAPHCDDLSMWESGILVCGNKFPENHIVALSKNSSEKLKRINDRLPTDATHEVEGKANANRMVFAQNGRVTAVSYSLYDRVVLFESSANPGDSRLSQSHFPIRFKGYRPPPKKYIRNPGDHKAHREWVSEFHSLVDLCWFQGKLYGKFRQGLDLFIWVVLDENGGAVRWDNNEETVQLLAVGPDSLIFGKYRESENGEIEWEVWRKSSF
jgi:hypothetical protein